MSNAVPMSGAMNPGLDMERRMECGNFANIPEFQPEGAEAAGVPPEVAATEGVQPQEVDAAAQSEDKSSGLMDKLRGSRLGTALAVGGSAIAMAGAAEGVNAERAQAGEPDITITNNHRTIVNTVGSRSTAESFSNANVVANARSMSRQEIRQSIRSGEANCDRMSPREAIRKGVVTQGYNGSGKGFAPENRKSTICRIDGKLVRIECGNLAKITHKPRPKQARNTVWVNSFANAKAKVIDTAVATAKGVCKTANTYASAYARGAGRAAARIRLAAIAKGGAKGEARFARVINRVRGAASARAGARAEAKVDLECAEKGGKVVKPEKPEQNLPPSVNLTGPQHVLTGGIAEICGFKNDPEGDAMSVSFSEKGNGNIVSGVYSGDEPGEDCVKYQAGSSSDEATVTETVRDSHGNVTSDSESFPIVDPEEDGRGQF